MLFWALLSSGQSGLGDFNNLGVHFFPLLYLLIDFVLNSYAFPIRHVIVTLVLAAIYIIINQVHSCTDKAVY
jgi:hypothetical protein